MLCLQNEGILSSEQAYTDEAFRSWWVSNPPQSLQVHSQLENANSCFIELLAKAPPICATQHSPAQKGM